MLNEDEWCQSKIKKSLSDKFGKLPNKALNLQIGKELGEMMRLSSFQKTIVSYMNQLNLQQEEMAQLRVQFLDLDKDKNGSLSYSEIEECI